MSTPNNPHTQSQIKQITKSIKPTKLSGFTLVELIVVITILVILSTIAFTSFSGFSGSARDSSRVSDIANISKSLEIAYQRTGYYPNPDNVFNVVYSGGILWNQGTIGDSVVKIIAAGGSKLSKKPTDPLSTKEYIYSKTEFGSTYQLKSDWEGDTIAYVPYYEKHSQMFSWYRVLNNLIENIIPSNKVFAATGNPILSYIKGNYNGLVVKTQTGGTIYVVAVPSIVLNQTGTLVDVLSLSGKLLINGKSNSGGIAYTPSIVFSGASLPTDDTSSGITNLALSIQNAYSGSVIASDTTTIKNLLSTVGTNSITALGSAVITNYLGGSAALSSIIDTGTNNYNVNNSLLFDSSNNQYLSRTPTSAGNQKKWTWSGWVKRGQVTSSANHVLFSATTGTNFDAIYFGGTASTRPDKLMYVDASDGSYVTTNSVFRDPSAWYHVVVAIDTAQSVASNRTKIYVNGVLQTLGETGYHTQNYNTPINGVYSHWIGGLSYNSTGYHDGYLSDVNFVDSGALDPTAFGEFNGTTGQWVPKQFSGDYGKNGFRLDFSSGSVLGLDSAPITATHTGVNNWAINGGITAANNQMLDTPLNNFATLNPLQTGGYSTLSKGNLRTTGNTAANSAVSAGTMSVNNGKWYWEVTQGATMSTEMIGVATKDISNQSALINAEVFPATYGVGARYNGYTNGISGEIQTVSAFSWIANDVIGIALDADNGAIYYSKNGTWLNGGNPASGSLKTGSFYKYTPNITKFITPTVGSYNGGYAEINFGQKSFTNAPPTGFKSLSTANLPEPAIVKPNQYFDVLTWTGVATASARTITGLAFTPDLVWSKARTLTWNHQIYDSVRGAGKLLSSNLSSSEYPNFQYGFLSSFNVDGFTTTPGSTDNENWNQLNATYVAWNWKANGFGVSNTDGSIPSIVSVNPTAGFSIVSFTGQTATNNVVGHGLNSIPKMIMLKSRSINELWTVYFPSILTSTQYLDLSLPNIPATGPSTTVTSTTMTFASGRNTGNVPYIAYTWSEVPGYSKFGSYIGNGSPDGPFVYTGFRPKYLMIKKINGTVNGNAGWLIIDTTRSPFNGAGANLFGDQNLQTEWSSWYIDFLSNGFKNKIGPDMSNNISGDTYIYAAFAEAPFKYANAR